MTLLEQWEQLVSMQNTPQLQQAFWDEYFAAETENYKKILKDAKKPYEGPLSEVAEMFAMTPVVFTGFLSGINDSLKQSCKLEELTEQSSISLDVDLETLYFNMLNAKAKWLYTLPGWDTLLDEGKRKEITKKWRLSVQAVKEVTTGRNDPCPCGSGKKYKKCCGA